VEAVGSGNDPLSSASRRIETRLTMRRGLTVAAIAALLAVAPGVADGVRGSSGIQYVPVGSAAGGHAASSGGHLAAVGGHEMSVGGQAASADTHGPGLAGSAAAPGEAIQGGGHDAGLVAQGVLRPDQLAASLFPTANGPNPGVGAGGVASGSTYLPHTSATSDQHAGSSGAAAQPLLSITIGLLPSVGGVIGGAGFGPLGGTVDVTVGSPDITLPLPTGGSFQGGPASDVVIDLSGLFATQFDGSLFAAANCNMAAGAMLYEVQTGRNVTGGQMRAWSGATTQGTSLEDLSRAFASQGQPLSIQRYMPWSDFQHQVASGRSAVVQGWYGYLPSRYVLQTGFVSGHSIFVLGYSPHMFGGQGGFWVMDPLGRGGYAGRWWPSDVLRTYGWSGKPGHAGDRSNLSYLGFVALQANRTAKQLTSAGGRPDFQDYWQTTKEALEAALKVIVTSGHGGNVPAIRGVVLLIRDPRLNLSAASAQNLRALSWPVAGTPKVVRRYSARHPDLQLATGRGSRVLAAAAGRVIFESARSGSATDTIWVQHGPDLFTAYAGLGRVSVKPGQWISKGELLGSVPARSAVLFSVSVGALPGSAGGHVDPTRFLPLN
jgi:hypothetical protein